MPRFSSDRSVKRRVALLTIALCAVARPAFADERTEHAYMERGIEARKERRDAEARDLFLQAYQAEASVEALAQIAMAEQALGEWVSAEQHLLVALASHGDSWLEKRRAVLRESLEAVREHLASLEVSCDAAGAELWIDGQRRGLFPVPPLRVAEGPLTMEVRANGTSMRQSVVAPGGEVMRLAFYAPPPPKASPEVAPLSPAAPQETADRSSGAALVPTNGGMDAAGPWRGAPGRGTRGDHRAAERESEFTTMTRAACTAPCRATSVAERTWDARSSRDLWRSLATRRRADARDFGLPVLQRAAFFECGTESVRLRGRVRVDLLSVSMTTCLRRRRRPSPRGRRRPASRFTQESRTGPWGIRARSR